MSKDRSVQIADELWGLLFITFDSLAKNQTGKNGIVFQGPTNDVQNRMIPKLRLIKQRRADKALLDDLEADYNICHATGWMTNETYAKSISLLRELTEN